MAGAVRTVGIDPMHVANEGRFVPIVAPEGRRGGAGGDARGVEVGDGEDEPTGMVLGRRAVVVRG